MHVCYSIVDVTILWMYLLLGKCGFQQKYQSRFTNRTKYNFNLPILCTWLSIQFSSLPLLLRRWKIYGPDRWFMDDYWLAKRSPGQSGSRKGHRTVSQLGMMHLPGGRCQPNIETIYVPKTITHLGQEFWRVSNHSMEKKTSEMSFFDVFQESEQDVENRMSTFSPGCRDTKFGDVVCLWR